MPRASIEISIPSEQTHLPVVWRLGALFNVVVNIRRARISSERGIASLDIDGSTAEVEQALDYLKSMHLVEGESTAALPVPPEDDIPQPNTIRVCLETVNAPQAGSPILSRVARDYRVVIYICFASFDEEGGQMEIAISGALLEVQRAIAFLHTTGLRVSPRERSVSDNGNL